MIIFAAETGRQPCEDIFVSHMLTYDWWYQGCVLTLSQPYHICDDVYSAYCCASCVRDMPGIRLTRLFLVRWQQGHMRYKFSRLTIFHRFFEGLNFHIFYPASAVTLLFYSGSYSEAGTASSPQQQQWDLLPYIVFPLKHQAGLDTMKTRYMGHRYIRLYCLLNNCNIFLRRFTFTKFLSQQSSSHPKTRTGVRHISRPVSYFKRHPLPGASRGWLKKYCISLIFYIYEWQHFLKELRNNPFFNCHFLWFFWMHKCELCHILYFM